MNKFRVYVDNDYHERQAIVIDIWSIEDECWSMLTAYPIENFNKNKDLAQMLVNQLHSIAKYGKVEFMVNNIEKGD